MKQTGIILILFAAAFSIISLGYSQTQKERRIRMEPRISVITLGVSDLEQSYRFYRELGLPTEMTPDGGIVVFSTTDTRLSLYQYDKLAEDVGIEVSKEERDKVGFQGITLAHTTRVKKDVDDLLKLAQKAGGKIIKDAQDVFWGGYSGYFSDPDGYLWEVNYSDAFEFDQDGSISFK